VLSPDSADLRFRGFPRESSPDGSHPKLYHYEEVDSTAPMKPFPGRYTRYGEVGELVRAADDRLAVFGEGDEVALGFRADRLPPLPQGWRRTFFLAAVGYCKDMDLYTAASESVEPLPYRAMESYPPPRGWSPHDDPARAAERAVRDTRVVEPLTWGAAGPLTRTGSPSGR
ncbi:MAG: FG-GAP-like repeat-containing protein, partial [Thermoanaerobaculia bacterium]